MAFKHRKVVKKKKGKGRRERVFQHKHAMKPSV